MEYACRNTSMVEIVFRMMRAYCRLIFQLDVGVSARFVGY
jgi:hypothetical protein